MSDVRDPHTDQVAPIPNDREGVHDVLIREVTEAVGDEVDDITQDLIDELLARKELGLSKYGTLLQPFNGRDFLRDILDEAIDGLAYVRGALQEAHERKAAPDSGEVRLLEEVAEGFADATYAVLTLRRMSL